MKIAFVGKGGSGKTTLAALFSQHLQKCGFPVLTIDADINQHLGMALGMTEEISSTLPHMGNEIDRIKEYVRGDNPRILSTKEMLKTTPPGTGSRLISLIEKNPILDYFARSVNGVRVMATGPFTEEDLGIKCYHSKTGAVELLLNHIADRKKEYVVVDMTAGADSFASGLFTRFDATFVVVEPTAKSVSVYEQYKTYAEPYGVKLFPIGNKIVDASDISFLNEKVGELCATFPLSDAVRKSERDGSLPYDKLLPQEKESLIHMQHAVDSVEKDWKRFYKQAVEFHIQNAESWGNASVGKDVTSQIDPHFSY